MRHARCWYRAAGRLGCRMNLGAATLDWHASVHARLLCVATTRTDVSVQRLTFRDNASTSQCHEQDKVLHSQFRWCDHLPSVLQCHNAAINKHNVIRLHVCCNVIMSYSVGSHFRLHATSSSAWAPASASSHTAGSSGFQ
jgi:hypothetical protein